MKRTWSYSLSLAVLVSLLGIACSKSNSTPSGGGSTGPATIDCSTVSAKFSTDVAGIISSKCATAGCHNAGSSNGPGALTDYATISAAKSSIRSSVVSKRMPRNTTLTDEQIKIIACWVDAGGLNN
jgi:uncharacterized membrane protein